MDSKDAPVVFDGVCRHMPQKAIGGILQLSSIFSISFTTPPDRRAALVEQAKALYSEFSGASDSKDLDRMNRTDTAANPVNPVQTIASHSAAPESRKKKLQKNKTDHRSFFLFILALTSLISP